MGTFSSKQNEPCVWVIGDGVQQEVRGFVSHSEVYRSGDHYVLLIRLERRKTVKVKFTNQRLAKVELERFRGAYALEIARIENESRTAHF
tara:strand:- start:589 stop:858 length:270 start_codon:yes stop_codon:yes gene_type:complete